MNIKNILTAITLLVGLHVSATAIEPTITPGINKTFTLDLADWATQTVDVQITDLYGRILLNDNMTATRKVYNLKNLEKGTYTIAVSNRTAIMSTVVDVTNDAVVSRKSTIRYRPVLAVAKDHFDVNALTEGKAVFVSIYSEGNTVFTKKYVNTPTVTQRYDLTQLPAGEYTIRVSKGNDVLTQSIVR